MILWTVRDENTQVDFKHRFSIVSQTRSALDRLFLTDIFLLYDCDNEYYEDKAEQAVAQIKRLGGKPFLQEVEGKSKPSFIKKIWTAITFPFMVFALIGGFIFQATKKELENDDE